MGKETADKKYIVRFLKIIPFMWGIFYEFSAFLCGSILLLILCKEIFREKRMKLYMNRGNIAFAMFVLGYWLSVLWAIDRGAAFTGAMKFTVPGIFFLLLMQLKKRSGSNISRRFRRLEHGYWLCLWQRCYLKV